MRPKSLSLVISLTSAIEAQATGKPFAFDGQGRAFDFPLLLAFGFINLESAWVDIAAIAAQLS